MQAMRGCRCCGFVEGGMEAVVTLGIPLNLDSYHR